MLCGGCGDYNSLLCTLTFDQFKSACKIFNNTKTCGEWDVKINNEKYCFVFFLLCLTFNIFHLLI